MRRILEIKMLRIGDWRLIPWYATGWCDHHCCYHREFTWLFLEIRVVDTTPN
jgi:hypothetical protein